MVFLNGDEIVLNALEHYHIPRYVYHGIRSLSPHCKIIEIEIFDPLRIGWSDKNDLKRLYDPYERQSALYEDSIMICDDKERMKDEFGYFDLEATPEINVGSTSIRMRTIPQISDVYPITLPKEAVSVLIDGTMRLANGLIITGGSMIDPGRHLSLSTRNDAIKILEISGGIDIAERRKIVWNLEHMFLIKQERLQDKRVVLTSGCFDIFHIGHLRFLETAKTLGDILIVCLSSDNQIRQLKGSRRPINKIEDRVSVLLSIRCVDYVLLYDEEDIHNETTLDHIMEVIDPFTWVKGMDYTKEAILTKHPKLKRIDLIPLIPGMSTTSIERLMS